MQISRQAQVWRAVHRELQTYTVGRAWVTLTLEEQRRHPLAPHRRPPRILTKGMAIATDTAELCAASVCAPSTILGTILSTIYHMIYNRCVQYDKRNMDVPSCTKLQTSASYMYMGGHASHGKRGGVESVPLRERNHYHFIIINLLF